jgi:YfiH family protein
MPLDFCAAPLLESLGWLEHGFGTRHTAPPSPDLATLKQIHSNVVLVAEHPGACGDGDALVTSRPGLSISVRTADCYPILLADARNQVIAAVHAGWRGTSTHIVEKTLEKMKSQFGTSPGDVLAAIGPGIGVCCYEVGQDVAREFGFEFRTHLDLSSENRKHLEAAGVPAHNIEALGVCTFCDAERFFSYRREKERAGRMTSFIRIVSGN